MTKSTKPHSYFSQICGCTDTLLLSRSAHCCDVTFRCQATASTNLSTKYFALYLEYGQCKCHFKIKVYIPKKEP